MGTKTVKISEDIYDALVFLKGTDINETMTQTVQDLVNEHDYTKIKLIHDEDDFFTIIEGRKRKLPEFSKITKIIRIDETLHLILNRWKIHPDESFNTLLFRLISYHYRNKPLYRIFTGDHCGNCEQLKTYVSTSLCTIPEIKEGVFFEVVMCDDHPKEMKEYDVHMMPLSVLYDINGNPVWHASGWHDKREVLKQVKGILE